MKTATSAADLKHRLALLELERACALETPLANDARYVADLEREVVTIRHAYVGSAVTELASLRARLSGPQWG